MPHTQQSGSGTSQGLVDKEQLKNQIKQAMTAAQEAADEAGANSGRLILLPPNAPVPPGATLMPPGFSHDGGSDDIPPHAMEMASMFFVFLAVVIIGWPLSRAFGRRVERRNQAPEVNPGTTEQLRRIEQAVEAMSIEVERISESQRFMAKIQSAQTPERIG
jgi:hypothetical protein